MNPGTLMSRGPIQGPRRLALVRYNDLAGDGVLTRHDFERDIYTVLEAHTRWRVLLNGFEMHPGGAYCDHTYGLMSSVHSPLKEAREFAAKHGIDPLHALDVVVEISTTTTPVVINGEVAANLGTYRDPFTLAPKDWFINNTKIAEWEAEMSKPYGQREWISRDALEPEKSAYTLVWSSREEVDRSADRIANLRAAFAANDVRPAA